MSQERVSKTESMPACPVCNNQKIIELVNNKPELIGQPVYDYYRPLCVLGLNGYMI